MLLYIFLALFSVALIIFLISAVKLLGTGRKERKESEKAEKALHELAEKLLPTLEKQGFHGEKLVYLPEAALAADPSGRKWCLIRQGRVPLAGPYPYEEISQVSVRENGKIVLQKSGEDPAETFLLPLPAEKKAGGKGGRSDDAEACESLRLYIHLRDPKNPTLSTPVLADSADKSSARYRRAVDRVNEALRLLAEILGA